MTNTLSYMPPLYYRHSGRFSAVGFPLAMVASVLVAVALGAAYAYVDMYNPCVSVLTFIATAGFGLGVGAATAYALRWAKVRNNTLAIVASVVAALVGLYASWVFWVYALLHQSHLSFVPTPLQLAKHPAALWRMILRINEVGVWSIGSSHGVGQRHDPVKGVFLWLIWVAEGVVILTTAILVTTRMVGSRPYCEACDRWAAPAQSVAAARHADPVELKRRLEAHDLDYLQQLGPRDPAGNLWLEAELCSCPTCQSLHTLTMKAVALVGDKKGKVQKKSTIVIDKLLLSGEEADRIKTLPQAWKPPAPPSVAPGPLPAPANGADPIGEPVQPQQPPPSPAANDEPPTLGL